jgi:hypothetical protein
MTCDGLVIHSIKGALRLCNTPLSGPTIFRNWRVLELDDMVLTNQSFSLLLA